MIVSIQQPGYLPWLGHLHRVAVSDVHIVLDTAQYSKNYFINRNKVRTSQGWCWLTVPVHARGRTSDLAIASVEIDEASNWRRKHWRTLVQCYGGAPHFADHAPFFAELYESSCSRLGELCRVATAYLLGALGIRTRILCASDMQASGTRDERLVALCREAGASVYLSGPHGRDYLRGDLFRQAGIRVAYHDYLHPSYPQVYAPFVENLSVIDLLFNCGPGSLEALSKGQAPVPR